MNNPGMIDGGLNGGVAIVTGGSRGIGRAIVLVFAGAGMEVVFTYRENAAAADEVIAAAPGQGDGPARGRARCGGLRGPGRPGGRTHGNASICSSTTPA
jgi:NAD(P)-dependent dehydrogenase (short-subunit alcohol dehydrogenase family)